MREKRKSHRKNKIKNQNQRESWLSLMLLPETHKLERKPRNARAPPGLAEPPP